MKSFVGIEVGSNNFFCALQISQVTTIMLCSFEKVKLIKGKFHSC